MIINSFNPFNNINVLPSFQWKNQDSFADYGIVISVLPTLARAQRNADVTAIQGHDGDYVVDYGTYQSITFPMTCTLLDGTLINEIKTWLDGYDNLIFSWDSDKYYKANLINRIDITQSFESYGEFPLLFNADPFGYDLNTADITLTAPSQIFNSGTAISKPVIKVYGEGTITLMVGATTVVLTNVVDYVTIDSDKVNCYKDTNNQNQYMTGFFPTLDIGQNGVSWTGTVTSVVITPNWKST